MPLDVRRLLTSETWIEAAYNPKVGHAAVCLWCEAWHQVPAGSLPDNNRVLARLAMCDARTWGRIRAAVLAGWVKCSDGLLYHPTVAEKALESWGHKIAQRKRTEAATAARSANRKSKPGKQEQNGHDRQRGDRAEQRHDQRDAPRNVHQETGTGIGQGTEIEERAPAGCSAEEGDHELSRLASQASMAMRRAGLMHANDADPRLKAALAAGVGVPELEAAAKEAHAKDLSFAWAVAAAVGRRRDAGPAAPIRGVDYHGRVGLADKFPSVLAEFDNREPIDATAIVISS
ncbi:DUF1376 domain-containing protein [Luteimonas gilva]|uniref:DUF1376 domain-containing protein n=1 Tax=Luteimonas gilva TaxID=2572684 RepID=A0A4U5JWH5_9GAMM|nr:DUF1376 domain-containing protein [Luteimonas gilva]